jgi:PAS domain S-box-containing protein/putative nucleotidyltransferase with HDIG domain
MLPRVDPVEVRRVTDKRRSHNKRQDEVQALRDRVAELESRISEAEHAPGVSWRSEEKYRTLVEESVQGVVVTVGPPPRIAFANQAMGDILGFAPEELQCLSPGQIEELLHPEDREFLFRRFQDWLAGRPARPDYQFRVIRRDGSVCWLEMRAARVEYEGRPAVQATFVDVTDRVRATEALKESEERYRALFEQSRDAISITTQGGRYVDVNPAFLALFGYTRDELMQTTAASLYANPEDRERFQEHIERSGAVKDYELRLRRKDGTEMDCVLTATVRRDDAGRVVGYEGITRDITARKRAERRLAAVYELGERLVLNRDESQIAAMVVDSAWQVLRYAVCGLWLVDDRQELLVRAAHRPCPDAPELPPFPLGGERGITVAVVRSAAPIYLPDVSKDPRYVDSGMGSRSELCVPLRVGGRAIGALSVESSRPDAYDDADRQLLLVLADRAAVAIENARLFGNVQRSERLYRTILESSADAIVSLDHDMQVTGWSAGAEQMLGYTKDEILGKSHSLLVPDQAEDAEARVSEAVRCHGFVRSLETKRLAKEGRLVEVELSMTDLGSDLGYTVILRDITDRKRAEDELRRLKEFHERIVQNMAEGIAVEDRDGRIEYVNPAAAALLGYDPAELTGRHWKRVIARECWVTVAEARARRVEGTSDAYEVELIRKDGTRVPVLVSGSPRFVDGGFAGTLAVFTDISEHRRAQQELRASVERLRAAKEGIIQAMTCTIEARDPHTAGHQRRVAELACAIARELGLPEDRVEGIRMAALIHDIGKIYAPAEVLSKPGRLSDLEFGLIKTHPQVGYDILKGIDFPWPVARVVLQHHETLDGCGYPLGLAGDEILLEARILGVADVIEAMSSHRPYRPALGLDRAMEQILEGRGTLYDADVVDCCLRILKEGEFEFETPQQFPLTFGDAGGDWSSSDRG